MQSLPPSTPTALVYLMMGVLPAVAERDIQIMRLVGQLAICDRELQSVSDILQNNLIEENIDFPGWSGLARRTAALYNLTDPLEIFQNPWESDRWSKHAKTEVLKYWTTLLKESAASYPSLNILDTSRLSLTSPHPMWIAAGSNPVSVRKATVVTWLLLNVYKTGERLHKMKKVGSPACVMCLAPLEDRLHFGLKCSQLSQIRNEYLNKFIECCPNISKYLGYTGAEWTYFPVFLKILIPKKIFWIMSMMYQNIRALGYKVVHAFCIVVFLNVLLEILKVTKSVGSFHPAPG